MTEKAQSAKKAQGSSKETARKEGRKETNSNQPFANSQTVKQ